MSLLSSFTRQDARIRMFEKSVDDVPGLWKFINRRRRGVIGSENRNRRITKDAVSNRVVAKTKKNTKTMYNSRLRKLVTKPKSNRNTKFILKAVYNKPTPIANDE